MRAEEILILQIITEPIISDRCSVQVFLLLLAGHGKEGLLVVLGQGIAIIQETLLIMSLALAVAAR